jgi:hypothetical protein
MPICTRFAWLAVLLIAPIWAEEYETVGDHVMNGVGYGLAAVISMSAAGACAETGNLPLAAAEVAASAIAASSALKEFKAAYREYNRDKDVECSGSDNTGSEGMSCDRDSSLR